MDSQYPQEEGDAPSGVKPVTSGRQFRVRGGHFPAKAGGRRLRASAAHPLGGLPSDGVACVCGPYFANGSDGRQSE
jgi:hypothetical protein